MVRIIRTWLYDTQATVQEPEISMVETRIQANARLTGIFGLDIDPIYHREKKYLNAKKKKKDEKEDFHHRGTESGEIG